MDAFLDALDADPHAQFDTWLAEARAAGLHEPEAMTLATATADGAPSARMVLLKGHDERGFVFFTNRESRKGAELAANPRAALVFSWPPPLRRQVRVEGAVEQLDDEASYAYFASRPRPSQVGAWASPQSRPVADRAALDALVDEVEARHAGAATLPLPPFWGGYRLVAEAIELWEGRDGRLHDRVRYTRAGGGWERTRLAP
ncbi:MAG: pyridoxamine 5'-phosphate oxidase [Gaiella sp.]